MAGIRPAPGAIWILGVVGIVIVAGISALVIALFREGLGIGDLIMILGGLSLCVLLSLAFGGKVVEVAPEAVAVAAAGRAGRAMGSRLAPRRNYDRSGSATSAMMRSVMPVWS